MSRPHRKHVGIRVVRLGSARGKDEGLRLGTVRRPPRGVAKEQYAVRNYYDVWLPELAPSAALVADALSQPWSDRRWQRYVRAYRREMHAPSARHLIDVLAALSRSSHFSVGCYCEDASRCHRSILRELLASAGAIIDRE